MGACVYVVINDVRHNVPPRLQAAIRWMINQEREITALPSGKIVFNLTETTVKPIIEKAFDAIPIG